MVTPVHDSGGQIVADLSQIVKEVSSLPECKNTSAVMAANLSRRIKLLSPMFDELLDSDGRHLADCEVTALKALSVAFSSAKDLLVWVNGASKLYQAAHRDEVSSKFLKATEQIEEALSQMDYEKLSLSEEVKEQTELVHAQLRRAKGKTESTYEQLEEDLNKVENEEDPGIVVLKRLSENLHIRTIEELRKESRAFHETAFKSNGEVGNSFEMMSTVFRRLNDYLLTVSTEFDLSDSEKGFNKQRCPVIPDDFRCPLSLELMSDPVIVSSGQTFERTCIQKWFDAGQTTCPKTNQPLAHTDLMPNYVLKSLITLWCENNGIELRTRRPGVDCDEAAITSLIEKLRTGATQDQRAAAAELRLLAKRNADNRICIAESGAIPPLVDSLSSLDSRVQEHAVTALLNLSINDANKGLIVNAGAIPDIVEVLKHGSIGARENAAATLFSLSAVDKNKVAIGAAGAIPGLITLLKDGTPRGKKDAATAIFNLVIYQGNKVRAVRAGIVPTLIGFVKDLGGGMVDEALMILGVLSSHPEGRVVIGEAGAMGVLVEVIRTGSGRNRENAAAVVWAVCMGDAREVEKAREVGAEAAFMELVENGTHRAKRKAASFLELLQRLKTEVCEVDE